MVVSKASFGGIVTMNTVEINARLLYFSFAAYY